MATENTGTLPARVEWLAETLRITGLLPQKKPQKSAADSWKAVTGEDPGSTATKKGLEEAAEGVFRDCRLSIVMRAERVDWLLSPNISPDSEPAPWATTGKFTEAIEVLRAVATQWMKPDLCPPFQRLAVGAVLHFPVPDKESAYRLLGQYLADVKLDPERSSDFSYQINRPRVFRQLGLELKVNRLMKWYAAACRYGGVLVDIAAGRSAARLGPANYACRLEMDINSDAEYESELPPETLLSIFQELTSYAEEISAKGDIP